MDANPVDQVHIPSETKNSRKFIHICSGISVSKRYRVYYHQRQIVGEILEKIYDCEISWCKRWYILEVITSHLIFFN